MNLRGEGPLVTAILKWKPLFLLKVQSLPQKPNVFPRKCHLGLWTRAPEQREFWTHTPSAGAWWDFGFEKGPRVAPVPLEPNLDHLLPLARDPLLFPAPGLPVIWAPRRATHPPGLCVGASGTCSALVSLAPVYLDWAEYIWAGYLPGLELNWVGHLPLCRQRWPAPGTALDIWDTSYMFNEQMKK